MMTKDGFHNALRILRSIDSSELGDPEWWPQFRDDPYHFFMRCPDCDSDVIWQAMVRRGAVKQAFDFSEAQSS